MIKGLKRSGSLSICLTPPALPSLVGSLLRSLVYTPLQWRGHLLIVMMIVLCKLPVVDQKTMKDTRLANTTVEASLGFMVFYNKPHDVD